MVATLLDAYSRIEAFCCCTGLVFESMGMRPNSHENRSDLQPSFQDPNPPAAHGAVLLDGARMRQCSGLQRGKDVDSTRSPALCGHVSMCCGRGRAGTRWESSEPRIPGYPGISWDCVGYPGISRDIVSKPHETAVCGGVWAENSGIS